MLINEQLAAIYCDWEKKLDDNEWYFSDAFDSITRTMTSSEAFSYVSEVVHAILELKDEMLIWETLYLLIELFSTADTTEVHPILKKRWRELEKHISNYDEVKKNPFRELKCQLRLN